MKKIISIFTVVATILVSLFVYNIFQTKDYQRLQNLGNASGFTQNFYLVQTDKTVEEHLSFLEELSKKYQVSIIRTDYDNDTIVKSIQIYADSFPDYFIPSEKKLKLKDGFYANYKSGEEKQIKKIPAFSLQNKLIVQSLEDYYSDSSHSILGNYVAISNSSIDTQGLIEDISNFYKVDKESLLHETAFSSVCLFNRFLILYSVLLALSFLIIGVIVISLGVADIHTFGIMKLNGLSNGRIIYERIRWDLSRMILSIAIINIYFLVTLEVYPPGFFQLLAVAQFLCLLYYIAVNGWLYLLVSKITISKLLKKFTDFKFGVFLIYSLKILVFIVMGYLLINTSTVVVDMYRQQRNYQQWNDYLDYSTLEYYSLTQAGEVDLETNTGEGVKDLFQLYESLEREANVIYTYHESYEKGQTLTDNKENEIYQFQDNIDILTVNYQYLKQIKMLDFIAGESASTRVILVPDTLKGKDLSPAFRAILFNLYSVKEQGNIKLADIPIKIIYYSEPLETFSFDFGKEETLKNPILLVVNPKNMLWFEKVRLTNTQLENPIKIKGGNIEQAKIGQLVAQKSKVFIPKFTKIKDLFNQILQFNQTFLVIMASILLFTFGIELFVAYALNSIVFYTERSSLAIKKLLGLKFFDRYKKHILAMLLIYAVTVIIVGILEQTVIMFPAVLLLIFADALLSIHHILKIESKQVAIMLKEG
ncbi:DUF1430 domain-containing protein [Streptococcus sp. FT1-55]|uniref:DUF1430 domain-containing protein n=1 Tax=Streptococcus sp. FT1-55 TaxID=3409805 RepID=UPI003BF60B96